MPQERELWVPGSVPQEHQLVRKWLVHGERSTSKAGSWMMCDTAKVRPPCENSSQLLRESVPRTASTIGSNCTHKLDRTSGQVFCHPALDADTSLCCLVMQIRDNTSRRHTILPGIRADKQIHRKRAMVGTRNIGECAPRRQ